MLKSLLFPALAPCRSRASQATGRDVYVFMAGIGRQGHELDVAEKAALEDVLHQPVIVHPCPFASWKENPHPIQWLKDNKNPLLFLKAMWAYRGATDPSSALSKRETSRLIAELQEAGARPEDRITLIGHSAGGQLALTLSRTLLEQSRYHVQTVITMGTPVATNAAPSDVRVVSATSEGDQVLKVTDSLDLRRVPENLSSYPSRRIVTLPATTAGQPNDHLSYLQPHHLRTILSPEAR